MVNADDEDLWVCFDKVSQAVEVRLLLFYFRHSSHLAYARYDIKFKYGGLHQ